MKTKKISKGPHIGHISILHNESHDLSAYSGVEAHCSRYYEDGTDFAQVFNTGDIPSDFVAAVTLLIMMDSIDRVSMMSSCDHFVMDVKGFGWYTNNVIGEVIKEATDKGNWHKVVRQHGENAGRDMWIQGTHETAGNFIVIDNADGIFIMSPDGLDETKKFKTVQEAMEFCDKAKRKVTWE